MQVSNESAKNIPADPCIDASRSSSLYQDNLTEIKVNALFGLNLIKAFYRISQLLLVSVHTLIGPVAVVPSLHGEMDFLRRKEFL